MTFFQKKNQLRIVLGIFRLSRYVWVTMTSASFGHVPPILNSSITSLPGATGALSTWPSSCVNALHLDTCEADSNLRDGDSRPLGGLFVSHSRSKFTSHTGYCFYLYVYYVH